jgi:hypothetical protein
MSVVMLSVLILKSEYLLPSVTMLNVIVSFCYYDE